MFRIFLFVVFSCSSLFSQENVTARFNYPKADSIARTVSKNFEFIGAFSEDADTTGKALLWRYQFLDDFQFSEITIGIDSLVIETRSGSPTGSSPVEAGWIDSDSVMHIAELHGGAGFRHNNPNNYIRMDLFSESGAPHITKWYIQYSSTNDTDSKLIIRIDAISGKVFPNSVDNNVNQKRIKDFILFPNYPNPFNSLTNLCFDLRNSAYVGLDIYNIDGSLIKEVVHEYRGEGMHSIQWNGKNENGKDVSTGIYIARLEINNQIITSQRMVLIK